jgi:hypothetical protein
VAIDLSAMPVKVRSPACQVKSAIPMINGMAAVIWLIGWAKSTWLVSQIRTPSARPDRTTPMKRFKSIRHGTIPVRVQRHLAALSAASAPAVGGRLPTGDGRPLRGLARLPQFVGTFRGSAERLCW